MPESFPSRKSGVMLKFGKICIIRYGASRNSFSRFTSSIFGDEISFFQDRLGSLVKSQVTKSTLFASDTEICECHCRGTTLGTPLVTEDA